jgi:hypothetical protein
MTVEILATNHLEFMNGEREGGREGEREREYHSDLNLKSFTLTVLYFTPFTYANWLSRIRGLHHSCDGV